MARQVGQQISTLHPGPLSISKPSCLPLLLSFLRTYPLTFYNPKPLLSMTSRQTLGQTFMLSEQLVSCLTGPPFEPRYLSKTTVSEQDQHCRGFHELAWSSDSQVERDSRDNRNFTRKIVLPVLLNSPTAPSHTHPQSRLPCLWLCEALGEVKDSDDGIFNNRGQREAMKLDLSV